MNIQNEQKISWCDATLNPVVGCPRGCEYCYAKKLNDRFGWCKDCDGSIDFTCMQFLPERLKALKSKKPKSIFMNSMSDIAEWETYALIDVLKAMQQNKHHHYIALTKDIQKLDRALWSIGWHMGHSPNLVIDFRKMLTELKEILFVGVTITTQTQADKRIDNIEFVNANFINIEPILEPIKINDFKNIKQIIIGAETGNRKGKIIPKKEWIDDMVRQADEHGIRVFMKESLRQIMGEDFRRDKLLWQI